MAIDQRIPESDLIQCSSDALVVVAQLFGLRVHVQYGTVGANKCHDSNVAMESYGRAAFVPRVPGVTVIAGHGSPTRTPGADRYVIRDHTPLLARLGFSPDASIISGIIQIIFEVVGDHGLGN